jgi:hypothetical protein
VSVVPVAPTQSVDDVGATDLLSMRAPILGTHWRIDA